MPERIEAEMAETTATPEQPVAETVAAATPAESPELLKAQLAQLQQHAKNKEEEAERNRKKLEKFELAEKERADAQLTKEQLLEKQVAEANARAEQALAIADAKLLKAAFLLKAKDLGFENPEDAYALANKEVKRKENGDFDEASIEAALKPLTGRLPVKAQGSGLGSPPSPNRTTPKEKQITSQPSRIRY
jgi:hypothetical protein